MNRRVPVPTDKQLSRDIGWILSSPPLIDPAFHHFFCGSRLPDTPCPLFKPPYPLSKGQSNQVCSLLRQRRHHLLGIYYETLWHHLLEQHPEIRILARNLQVQKDQATLGEYDLIYQHTTDQVTRHRELAVKFYLGIPCATGTGPGSWNHWIGPGLKDRMDRKLARMLEHQATLSDTPEGQYTLAQNAIPAVTRKEILLQGYLFYPVHGYCPSPEGAHPDHHRGYWVTQEHLVNWLHTHDHKLPLALVPKHLWLSSYTATPEEADLYSAHSLRQLELSDPVMVIACNQGNQLLRERFRFFLVPADWPALAQDVTLYFDLS